MRSQTAATVVNTQTTTVLYFTSTKKRYRATGTAVIPFLVQKNGQGDTETQFTLGSRYKRGKGVRKNFKKAVEWLTKAAEQGKKAKVTFGKI